MNISRIVRIGLVNGLGALEEARDFLQSRCGTISKLVMDPPNFRMKKGTKVWGTGIVDSDPPRATSTVVPTT